MLSTNTSILKLMGRVPLANKDYLTTIMTFASILKAAFSQAAAVPSCRMVTQGKAYIGSFVEGSAADLNPKGRIRV